MCVCVYLGFKTAHFDLPPILSSQIRRQMDEALGGEEHVTSPDVFID